MRSKRSMERVRWFAGAIIASAIPLSASAFGYDEIRDGDLSNDRLGPTFLNLAPGANDLAMTSGRVAGIVDRDYFTFDVPEGSRLDSILLLTANVDGAVSFIGLQTGSSFGEPPTGTNVANLLGWSHFSGSQVGTDILDDIAVGLGAQGFIPPLGSGHYTFWAQDFGVQANYSMRFNLSAIPEPGPACLTGIGLFGLEAYSRRAARGRSRTH